MALLENRTGASVNPGNRQDNAQIVVFVADQAHDGSQACGVWKAEFSTRPSDRLSRACSPLVSWQPNSPYLISPLTLNYRCGRIDDVAFLILGQKARPVIQKTALHSVDVAYGLGRNVKM